MKQSRRLFHLNLGWWFLACCLFSGAAQAQDWTSHVITNPASADRGKNVSVATTKVYCNGVSVPLCQRIGVAYQDFDTGALRYATSLDGGANWADELVMSQAEAGAVVGAHISLRYKPGPAAVPFIAFQKETATPKLMLARKANMGSSGPGAWDKIQLNPGGISASMIFDGPTKVRIAHLRGDNLNYVTLDAPYSASGIVQQDLNIVAKAVKLETDDLNNKHLLWATTSAVRYKMASLDNPFPGTSEIVDNDLSAYPVNAPYRIAMAIDWQRRPHIAYIVPYDDNVFKVRHKYKDSASTWDYTHIASIPMSESQVPGISIILDDQNDKTDSIAFGMASLFFGTTYRFLWVSHRVSLTAWQLDAVDYLGGQFPGLLRLFNGNLAAVHYDSTASGKELRFSEDD
jgi:hypothetical protein